jgi:hypothetical protein
MRDRPVVAWDGEGATLADGSHIYTYLANSLGGAISDPRGLPSARCLSFMLSEAERAPADALHVAYGMGYDVNMLLSDMPRHLVEILWRAGFVRWGAWGIYYRPNRMLSVSRFDGDGRDARKVASVSLVDAVGFSQAPFVQAVRAWLGDDPRVGLIETGKARRGDFDPEDTDGFVSRYTAAELSALVDIERRMMGHLKRLDIPLKRHDGAGSLAAALLERHGVKETIPDAHVPDGLVRAAAYAYFGGRIELVRFGRAEGLHAYDIRSAYPAGMALLPDFRAGRWAYRTVWRKPPRRVPTFSVSRVRWSAAPAPFHPFPFREPTGAVRFPPAGEGWYWGPEVNAALRAPGTRVEVLEQWSHLADSGAPLPFAWVADRYAQRAELKESGDHAQLVLKLGLNSLYGKLAQRLGYRPGSDRLPPFHSLIYAGFVTAYTRARMLEAALQAPDSVVFFATDGLVTTAPLALEEGAALGDWETDRYAELVAVQSGVYFLRPEGADWRHKYRGWGKGVLEPSAILRAWEGGGDSLPVPVTRFVGMGRALATDWTLWRRWHTEERTLLLHPCGPGSKRRPVSRPLYRTLRAKGPHPARELVRTWPVEAGAPFSSPARSPWDAGLWAGLDADDAAEMETAGG